ncbi:TonB-dependent siderophore receptor [[Pseudomonas] boreopolis]|uniref:TonB-dependent siderophore receptor n=1 Tax=Xanthomonas boreopolis TaxID=86183 RepID=UPI003D3905A1
MTSNAPGPASAVPLLQTALRRNALFLPMLAALAAPLAARAEAVADAKTLDSVKVTAERQDGYTVRETSTATKLALSPLETPQSVSVIGRQQMDDFALNSAIDVLDQAAGVQVEKIETDRAYYTARGFDITNFQVDGLGLPFTNGGSEGDIDTAIYDRVEVLRGANGLLSSTGNPSATINFVRKRPTGDTQGSVAVGGGSWSNYRVDADLSGKLNQSGSVRGRLVGAWQDGDSYLDRYSRSKKVFYGVVEADLSETTLLTVGASYQQNKPKGAMWGALPLYYTDGSPTDYARSTSTSADWSAWESTDKRAFLELEQALDGDWKLKAALNYRKIETEGDLFYVFGTPDHATGLGLYAYPSYYMSTETHKTADVYVSGTLSFGGRTHDVVAGVNWGKMNADQLSNYDANVCEDNYTALPDLATWDGHFSKPSFNGCSDGANFDMTRKTAYATVRWNLSDRFKLITGVNYTHAESGGENYGSAHAYDDSKTTPFVGAVYNFDPNYALYASYAEIFNPQTELDTNFRVLDPVKGNNAELGIKGQWLDGRVNGAFAFFRAKQDGVAEAGDIINNIQTYHGINATSTGYEAELAGQLNEYWQISTSYTQLGIKGDDGENVRTYVPRRTAKLATTYRIPGLEQLKIGANVRWQDAISRDQLATDLDGNEIFTRQGSYALVGVMTSYDFTPQVSATLNVNNVTDRKYINSLYWAQNFYGAGRNWWLSVNYRF